MVHLLPCSLLTSLEEKLSESILAPSGVNVRDILEVSKIILDNQFHPKWKNPKEVINVLPEISYDTEQLLSTHDVAVDKLKESLDNNTRVTLALFSQEAASYPSLGIICVHFVCALEREFKATYLYSNQHSVTQSAKRGPDPSSDSCVVIQKKYPDSCIKPKVRFNIRLCNWQIRTLLKFFFRDITAYDTTT